MVMNSARLTIKLYINLFFMNISVVIFVASQKVSNLGLQLVLLV